MEKSSFLWWSMLFAHHCIRVQCTSCMCGWHTGQEDPSLPLHNPIFFVKQDYCTASVVIVVVVGDAIVASVAACRAWKKIYILNRIYFLLCSVPMSIAEHSFSVQLSLLILFPFFRLTQFFPLNFRVYICVCEISYAIFFSLCVVVCLSVLVCLQTSKNNVCKENTDNLQNESNLQKSCRIDFFPFSMVRSFARFCLRILAQQCVCVLSFLACVRGRGGVRMTTFEKWFVRISIKSLWWEWSESVRMIYYVRHARSMLQLCNKLMCCFPSCLCACAWWYCWHFGTHSIWSTHMHTSKQTTWTMHACIVHHKYMKRRYRQFARIMMERLLLPEINREKESLQEHTTCKRKAQQTKCNKFIFKVKHAS